MDGGLIPDTLAEAAELTGLRRVLGHSGRYDTDPPRNYYVAVEFEFAEAVLVAEVDPDLDQILLRISQQTGEPLRCWPRSDPDITVSELGLEPWWPELDQTSVGWIWVLQNQQGYQDGVQIEFVSPGQRRTIIQLIAIASAFQINIVTVLDGAGYGQQPKLGS